jgi:Zn-dependent peptidase ImmA (M78 family)/DNA-binding XRE family transcriptional regulator
MITTKKINGDMLVLAREYRGITQEELAITANVAQSTIAKIENGIKNEIDDTKAALISNELGFPIDFFYQQEDILSFGSSAYFYRKKTTMSASERKKIHSLVNILRIGIKKTLKFIDIEASKELPLLEIDGYYNSASQAAKALRVFWSLPDGPIKNLTALLESAGIIIIPCDFGTKTIDATSLRLSEMPPLIFINKDIPGDRWRFTLAHELAHLIIHRIPHERMEEEADEFAAEFLVPENEIMPQFRMIPTLKLPDLIKLKEYWKVSIAMLVMRAKTMCVLNDTQVRYQFMMLSKNGFRINEPAPLQKEATRNIDQIISTMVEDLGFTKENIAKALYWPLQEVETLFSFPSQVKNQAQLRIVR